METNFNTVCEDNSPDELGDLLVTMWRQCCAGDFTLATNALAREFVRHETLSKCQGLGPSGDVIDSDDDEDEEGAVMDAGGLGAGDEGADAGGAMEAEAEQAPSQPLVDPDGWETVIRGKSKGKGKR